jgi:uncharacterized BrkB/YihY/UPF0761 family membrane protein
VTDTVGEGPGDPTEPSHGGGEPPAVEDTEERSLSERLRTQRDHLEDRIESTRVRLEDARPNSRVIDTVFRAFERDVATGGGVLSAAVAFRIFLFLVPFVFFLVVAFGYTSEATNGSATGLSRSMGIGGLIAKSVKGAADLSGGQRLTALFVSAFALFLGSRAAVKVLRITHGLIWRVPIPKLRSPTRAAGIFTGFIVIALLTSALVGWLRSQSLLLGIFGVVVWLAVPFGLWLLVSLYLPRADCPWWALLPGAAVCAIGAELLHVATIYWFSYEIQKKSDTYGAIGVSLALLLWAYLLGRIITASAAVNAAFWYRSEERLGHEVPAEVDLEERLAEMTPGPVDPVGDIAPDE